MMPFDTIEGRRIEAHHPQPRIVVNEDGWRSVAHRVTAGDWTLLGLWGDASAAHMAILDEGAGDIAVVTIECPDG
jgi:hypothetical protein